MRVLFDANIFISYLLFPKNSGVIRSIFNSLIQNQFTLILPEPLLDEVSMAVTHRPQLATRLSQKQLSQFLVTLKSLSTSVPLITDPIPAISRDQKDDYLISYAIIGEADYLVTGDKDLLVLKKIGNLQIITPTKFVQLISD